MPLAEGAPTQDATAHPFPRLRVLALLWLAAYIPSYAAAYGPLNFLFLCNLGVFLTVLGLWRGSALLLSSQAVASLVVGLLWAADTGGRLLTGKNPFGFAAYMWDPQYPLSTRLLSTYHVWWPMLLVWCLRRIGYDRRALALQAGIAAVVIAMSRLTDPALNINFAHRDPFLGRSWGPAPLHLALMFGGLVTCAYWPAHWALSRFLPPRFPRGAG